MVHFRKYFLLCQANLWILQRHCLQSVGTIIPEWAMSAEPLGQRFTCVPVRPVPMIVVLVVPAPQWCLSIRSTAAQPRLPNVIHHAFNFISSTYARRGRRDLLSSCHPRRHCRCTRLQGAGDDGRRHFQEPAGNPREPGIVFLWTAPGVHGPGGIHADPEHSSDHSRNR